MTINDPRARQAMYMSRGGKKRGVYGGGIKVFLILVLPILLALVLLWALVF